MDLNTVFIRLFEILTRGSRIPIGIKGPKKSGTPGEGAQGGGPWEPHSKLGAGSAATGGASEAGRWGRGSTKPDFQVMPPRQGLVTRRATEPHLGL